MYEDSKPSVWYEQITEKKSAEPAPDELLIQLKDEAKKCLDAEVASYNIKNSKGNSNFQWIKTVMAKGGVSDKVAAYVVSIQDKPVYSLDTISNLVGMVKVGKKKECIIVIEHLIELFLMTLLPPTRKLIPFRERPLLTLDNLTSGNAATRKKYLALWYFEDQLKETYALFVRALNTMAHDTVDSNKEKALTAMYKLLAENAEQEKNLLVYIVNKLGDPSRKVASKAIYCLTQLLYQHSNMQGVVLGEIEKLLFRTNISMRAQYYGLCFLTQFSLDHEHQDVARRLIEVYFSFFKACVKKGDVNSRMMSALLMGVKRAFPFAKLEIDKISSHIDTLYRIVHIAQFNISIHALSLLYQVSGDTQISDRFYLALYKKLLDPQVCNTTHQAMFLHLVYKALNQDTKIERIKVLIKRLLQNAIYAPPSTACGILYTVSQLISKKPGLSALILRSSTFSAPQEEGEDDGIEKYADVLDEDDVKVQNSVSENEKIAPGWLHMANETEERKVPEIMNRYNSQCRNPLYAGGEFCTYTELNLLRHHFHPTVVLFTQNLLNGKRICYSGDPLQDFSLIKFLERFVFKNPKKVDEDTKLGCHPTFGRRKAYVPRGVRNLAVNSNVYLNERQQKIPVEELYLYKFLQQKHQDRKSRVTDDDESDVESVASDEFEEMLDKMTGANKDEDEELDYMDAVGDNLKSNKNKNEDAEEEVDEDDNNDMNEESDDGLDMTEEDKELTNLTDDDENSDLVFDSENEEDEIKAPNNKKRGKKDDISSLFASAEEFASLLEDEGASSKPSGGSNAWANKDNAKLGQLAWEEKRNRWVKGYDKKKTKFGKNFASNSAPSGNKRKASSKNKNHNKTKIKRF